MRITWGASRCWCLALLLATGCWTTNWTTKRNLEPPTHPEEYVLPPVSANRFSAPPDYPRQPDKDRLARNKLDEPTPPNFGPGAGRFGAASGSGMRGQ